MQITRVVIEYILKMHIVTIQQTIIHMCRDTIRPIKRTRVTVPPIREHPLLPSLLHPITTSLFIRIRHSTPSEASVGRDRSMDGCTAAEWHICKRGFTCPTESNMEILGAVSFDVLELWITMIRIPVTIELSQEDNPEGNWIPIEHWKLADVLIQWELNCGHPLPLLLLSSNG